MVAALYCWDLGALSDPGHGSDLLIIAEVAQLVLLASPCTSCTQFGSFRLAVYSPSSRGSPAKSLWDGIGPVMPSVYYLWTDRETRRSASVVYSAQCTSTCPLPPARCLR